MNTFVSSLSARAKRLLPVLGLVLFFFLVWKYQPARIAAAMSKADIRSLWPLLVLTPLILFLQAFKWQVIISSRCPAPPLKTTFLINLAGLFYGTVTPGHSGSVVKIKYLQDATGLSLSSSSATFVLDKFIDVIVLLFFVLSGTGLLLGRLSSTFILGLLSAGALVLTFFMLYNQRRAKAILTAVLGPIVPEALRARLRAPFAEFFHALPKRRRLWLPVLISVLLWTGIFTQSYVIARSLGIDIHYTTFILLYPLGTAVGLLPMSISGLGTRDVTLISVFGLFGVRPEPLIALSLIDLVFCKCLPALAGWFAALTANFKHRDAARDHIPTRTGDKQETHAPLYDLKHGR